MHFRSHDIIATEGTVFGGKEYSARSDRNITRKDTIWLHRRRVLSCGYIPPTSSGLKSKQSEPSSGFYLHRVCSLLDLLFDPEDGDSMFFLNIDELLQDCTVSRHGR
jgi:hypothetical protein